MFRLDSILHLDSTLHALQFHLKLIHQKLEVLLYRNGGIL